jgi:hypothetical protein
MALKQFGLTTYQFGFNDASAAAIAATLGLTPQEVTISEEPEVEAEGKDAYNRTVAYVVDDEGKKTLTMNGYVSNSTLFDAAKGKTFTYSGKTYIARTAERGVKKDDFQMGTVTAVNFSKITSGAAATIAS